MYLKLHQILEHEFNLLLGLLNEAADDIPEFKVWRAWMEQFNNSLSIIGVLAKHSYETQETRQAIRVALAVKQSHAYHKINLFLAQLAEQRKSYHVKVALLQKEAFWNELFQHQHSSYHREQLNALRAHFMAVPCVDLIHIPTQHLLWFMGRMQKMRENLDAWHKSEVLSAHKKTRMLTPVMVRLMNKSNVVLDLLRQVLTNHAEILIWRLKPVFETTYCNDLDNPFFYAHRVFNQCYEMKAAQAMSSPILTSNVKVQQVHKTVSMASRCATPHGLEQLDSLIQPQKRALCPLQTVRHSNNQYTFCPEKFDAYIEHQPPRYTRLKRGHYSRYQFSQEVGEHVLKINRLHHALSEQLAQLPQNATDKIQHFLLMRTMLRDLEGVMEQHEAFLRKNNIKENWINKLFRGKTLEMQQKWKCKLNAIQLEINILKQHILLKTSMLREYLINTAYQERLNGLILGIAPTPGLITVIDDALHEMIEPEQFNRALTANKSWALQLCEMHKIPVRLLQQGQKSNTKPSSLKYNLALLIEQGQLAQASDFLGFVCYARQSGQLKAKDDGWLQEAYQYLQSTLAKVWTQHCQNNPIKALDYATLLTGFGVLQKTYPTLSAWPSLRNQWRALEKVQWASIVSLESDYSQSVTSTMTSSAESLSSGEWLLFVGELLKAINTAMNDFIKNHHWQWPISASQWKIFFKTKQQTSLNCMDHPSSQAVVENLARLKTYNEQQQSNSINSVLDVLQNLLMGKIHIDILAVQVGRVKSIVSAPLENNVRSILQQESLLTTVRRH